MWSLLKKKQTINNINKINVVTENNKSLQSNKIIPSSPSWKEWNNSIYSYNKEYIKLLVHKDKLVNFLFKSYFNLTQKLLQKKRKRFNHKRFSSNRLFLSDAEIKHTNTNVNITLFLLNKNKNFMKHKLTKLKTRLFKKRIFKWDTITTRFKKVYILNIKTFKFALRRQIIVLFKHIIANVKVRSNILFNISKHINLDLYTINSLLNILKKNAIKEEKKENYLRNLFLTYKEKKRKLVRRYLTITRKTRRANEKWIFDKLNRITSVIDWNLIFNKPSELDLYKMKVSQWTREKSRKWRPFTLLKKKNFRIYKFLYYYQMLIFNKNKFTNWFLNYRGFGLINIISKIYNKKVEFNIVNLKSIHLNSDIYSKAISLKLRKRKFRLLRILKKALFKIKLPRLFDLYNIDKKTYRFALKKKNVLNYLKYKLVSGVRFEASGRLSRRLVASRAVFKFRYVGSLNNIYSSFVGLPAVMLRGHLKSNMQYTMINSKTRNGAFGLKGWTGNY